MSNNQREVSKQINDLIGDSELSELLHQWQAESDDDLKNRLKSIILKLIERKERQTFMARYILRDFENWNDVLSQEEGAVSKAHKAEFFKPHLINVLYENNGMLSAIQAIRETIEKVNHELTLADYKLTASKRFRYDTTIRFLADSLRKEGLLSSDKKHKNKVWALTEKGIQYAKKLIAEKT